MLQESPRVLLDANAIRDLFRPTETFRGRLFNAADLAALRAALEERVADGRLRIIVTQPITWELTSIIEDESFDLYRETMTFYVNIGREWFMRHEHERARAEIRLRRPLLDSEAFLELDLARLLPQLLSTKRIDGHASQHRGAKEKERAEEAAERLATVAELQKRIENWRADLDQSLSGPAWDRTISSYVRGDVREIVRKHRLALRGAIWPHPRAVRTLWFGESFYAAKARRVFVESRRELTSKTSLADMPDVIDSTHFRDAAYADVLVTTDRVFRETAIAARVDGLRVLTFAAFAGEIVPTLAGRGGGV